MGKPIFSFTEIPSYHAGMLLVKIRPSLGQMVASRGMVLESAAMSALSNFERAGLIKRITPLAPEAEAEITPLESSRAMSAMIASTTNIAPTNINAGVNLVELEQEQHTGELQIALAKDPDVEFVSQVPVRYLVSQGISIAAVPPPAATIWNLAKIRFHEARSLPSFQDANEIRVAVLDTGIDNNHPDLQGRIESYVFAHPDLPRVSSEQDVIGHGTHVAGTIGASINNNLGINGICTCKLAIWKIFDDRPDFISCREGYAYFVDPVMYRRALADCLEENVNVINLSIGGTGRPDFQEQQLFDALLANGTTIVAAMGNEGQFGSPTSYPAAIRGVIAVGATNINDTIANFSNRGNHISLSAPGVAIWSTLPTHAGQFGFDAICSPGERPRLGRAQLRETDYDAWDGTSMASPHVAAAAALLLANRGSMSPAEVRRQLQKTADRVPAMNGQDFNADFGAGRLNK